ncbi:LANO_0E07866g1_1 [Lachancea nothofagi CBS 11611]|uniref:LANO_0E07866g1_1 n=1 Tax=Lachancea nothofagi CBS 11611 TaxID=1266666 RepID=A0A1G4JUR3_9SACH|nr:LANO_0E07866g1_1 [Lachancea nothofagi CBS 11611]
MFGHQLISASRIGRKYSITTASDVIKQKFSFSESSHCIRDLLSSDVSSKVVINGWIDKKPKKVGKSLIFGTLRDTKGDVIQLVDSDSFLKAANVEDVVQIEGQLNIRKAANEETDVPQFEIKLLKVNTLNKSGKKPSQLSVFKNQGNFPPEFRYLQLRLPKYQAFLKKRHEIASRVREHLNGFNFTEIETPILFKSTPEGAREFLVPSRNKQNQKPAFYALPQSPQQYKQLLMASGVERYYQLARCFRDEDLRSDRQPEFTQIDLEMAFANGSQVMQIIESTITKTWNTMSSSGNLHTLTRSNEIVPVTQSHPVTKITYREAMTQYGIDKPDLRFPSIKIVDMSEFKAFGIENNGFPIFEIIVLRNAFRTSEDYKENWSFLSDEHQYKFRSPIVVPIDSEEMEQLWFEKFMSIANFENPTLMNRFLNLKQGDIICGATREPSGALFENPTPLGRLRQLVTQSKRGSELYQQTENAVAVWVIDFPLFSPAEYEPSLGSKKPDYPHYNAEVYSSTHHPFTMVQLQDLHKLQSNPSACLGQHYDFVINGVELGGGSTRIHDPVLQNFIFKSILKIQEPEKLFGHLLTAFESGTPPHAGFAIGFDRMCAMLCGTNNIRDVIAFPKSISGCDLLVGSPSNVPKEILEEYNLEFADDSQK